MHNTQKLPVPIQNIQQFTAASHFPIKNTKVWKIPIKGNNHQLLLPP